MLGSPPGYVGYDEGGQLTEQVRRRPYSVILFDEVEKAHPEIFNALLQILEDGRLTDAKGRVVDFKNTVIILTSNLGSQYIYDISSLGFEQQGEQATVQDATSREQKMREKIMESVNNHFKPEFINRLDEIIIFHPLNQKMLTQIVQKQIDLVSKRLSDRDIELSLGQGVYKFIVEKGYDHNFGARPMKRAIQKHTLDPLAKELIEKNIKELAKVTITLDKSNNTLKIGIAKKRK